MLLAKSLSAAVSPPSIPPNPSLSGSSHLRSAQALPPQRASPALIGRRNRLAPSRDRRLPRRRRRRPSPRESPLSAVCTARARLPASHAPVSPCLPPSPPARARLLNLRRRPSSRRMDAKPSAPVVSPRAPPPPPKEAASPLALARLGSILLHGLESPAGVAHARLCGPPRLPEALAAARVASARMADALRAFAATYIPISDLFVDEAGGVRSATLADIVGVYDVQADFDLLRSALTAHMQPPVAPEGVARWRGEGRMLMAAVFETRRFDRFYRLVEASEEFLRCGAQAE